MSDDVYKLGEQYLNTRFMFRSPDELDKAITALRSSRGGMSIEIALFAILEDAGLLSDAEYDAGRISAWNGDPS